MNRLKQPGDSDYDVLGVSPGASSEEIHRAFRQLIDGEGYRVGVPLNRQWLRAHQIKHAYATLSDPAKRQTYDETLSKNSDTAPWAMMADDRATDELILSEPEPEVPAEEEPPPAAVLPPQPEIAPFDSEPDPAPDLVPEADEQDVVESTDDQASLDFVPNANDNERTSTRRKGIAAVAAVGVGLLLFSSWPGWRAQLSSTDGTPGVTADAWQAVRAVQGWADSARAPDNSKGVGASDFKDRDAVPGDSPAASTAPGQTSELQDASGEGTAQSADDLAPIGAGDAQSDARLAGITPATTPAPVEPAPAPAMAAAPQPVPAASVVATAPTLAGNSGSQVASPPKWVGGGPTDADNRRGRYQGAVGVQVLVEQDGRVSNCAAVRGSGSAGLDAMTCQLIRDRARFNPALDAEGRPVASEAYTTIVWGRKQRK